MTSDSRAKFEEWASGFGWRSHEMTRRQDSYADHAVSLQWQSWVAGWSARDSEVERLREALQRAADMLVSASHYVPKNGGLMKLIEVQDACFSLLSSQVKESGNG